MNIVNTSHFRKLAHVPASTAASGIQNNGNAQCHIECVKDPADYVFSLPS